MIRNSYLMESIPMLKTATYEKPTANKLTTLVRSIEFCQKGYEPQFNYDFKASHIQYFYILAEILTLLAEMLMSFQCWQHGIIDKGAPAPQFSKRSR